MVNGSCLCGAVAFAVSGALAPIQVCHCGQCRKAQGGPFATNIPVHREDFRLLRGEDRLRPYASSPGKRRWFCSTCGSPIYSERDSLPDVLRLRAGTLDGELPVAPQGQYYVASRANWWPLDEDLPCFAQGKPD